MPVKKYNTLNSRVLRKKQLTFKQRKARRRRRRIIRAWCARIIFLAMIVGTISVMFFIVSVVKAMFTSSKGLLYEKSRVPVVKVASSPIEIEINDTIIKEDGEQNFDETPDVTEEEIVEEVEEFVARISAYEPGVVYYYTLTYEEKLYIARVVYAESRGECFEGQVAVAAVILNRFVSNDPFFKNDSIYSVVTQSNQFAPIDWVTDEKLAESPSCMEAVEQACLGWDSTRVKFSQGALYFFAPEEVEGYQKEIRENIDFLQIGNHYFHFDFEKTEK